MIPQCIQIIARYDLHSRINWLPVVADHRGIDNDAEFKEIVHSEVRMIKKIAGLLLTLKISV